MDRITQDLLNTENITDIQVERIRASGVADDKILETLVKVSVVSANYLKRFILEKLKNGQYHLSILDDYPFINKQSLLISLAESMNISFIDLDSVDIDTSLSERIPLSNMQRFGIIPLFQDAKSVTVAFSDPLNMQAKEVCQRAFPSKPVNLVLASSLQIQSFINKIQMNESVKDLIQKIRFELTSDISTVKEEETASSILKLIEIILSQAIRARGSDIHIEPTEKNCIVRTRIDGHLKEIFAFDKDIYPPLVSRVKLLSNLDIAEKRKPQDGRFSSLISGQEFDFRISTLPILNGESIVMRILDKSKVMIKLEESGMSTRNYDHLVKALRSPYGIVLVTGPTGSGKTTTLYGALNELRNTEDKIITVEDPVEYKMNQVQQVQVSTKVGLTFSAALRSILRQDPDKIMIGEIRDQETLRIAIQAALTGHLVLSTLHTNDALSAINRMEDMGIESYLISGSVIAIQAQRLVRKICKHCKEEYQPVQTLIDDVQKYLPENATFYKGVGCKECSDTGFMGREMLSEVLTISEDISTLIARGGSKDEITQQAYKEGFQPLIINGIDKVVNGITTLEEVLKVAKL